MLKKILTSLTLIVIIGFFIPQTFVVPVSGANISDYNQESYWYFPWGTSGSHKGVDIFTKEEGVEVVSATSGIVLAKGSLSKGGNFVLIIGPKWRIHYYAHLQSNSVHVFQNVKPSSTIGTVGTSGNATGKQPHIHYSILSLLPYPLRIDFSHQGWKKMFYLNPIPYLNAALA